MTRHDHITKTIQPQGARRYLELRIFSCYVRCFASFNILFQPRILFSIAVVLRVLVPPCPSLLLR